MSDDMIASHSKSGFENAQLNFCPQARSHLLKLSASTEHARRRPVMSSCMCQGARHGSIANTTFVTCQAAKRRYNESVRTVPVTTPMMSENQGTSELSIQTFGNPTCLAVIPPKHQLFAPLGVGWSANAKTWACGSR